MAKIFVVFKDLSGIPIIFKDLPVILIVVPVTVFANKHIIIQTTVFVVLVPTRDCHRVPGGMTYTTLSLKL